MNGLAQAETTHAELTINAMNASALPAPTLNAGTELWRPVGFDDKGFARHT